LNDTGLTYNTTSTQLTTPNLTATTSLTTNGSFIISGYRPYEIGSIAGNATALPGLPTTYGTYLWTASTTASTNTVITLPTIITSMVGKTLAFRRLTYSSINTLIIKTPSGGATIMARNNTNSNHHIISTHEPNSYAIHISITNQFENKIDEVELKKHTTYSGVIILLNSV
jgi:hypothetical protein